MGGGAEGEGRRRGRASVHRVSAGWRVRKGRGVRQAEDSNRQAEPAAMALVECVIWGSRRDIHLLLLLLLLPPWVPAGECGWAMGFH